MHLAGADIEGDVVAGRERAEALGQPLRREKRRRFRIRQPPPELLIHPPSPQRSG